MQSPFDNKLNILPTSYSFTNGLIKRVDTQLKLKQHVSSSLNLAVFGFFAGVASSAYHTVALAKTPIIMLKFAARVTVFSLPVVGTKLDEKLPSLPQGFEYSAPFVHALKVVAYVFSAIFTPVSGLFLVPRFAVWLNQTLSLAERQKPVRQPVAFDGLHQGIRPVSSQSQEPSPAPTNEPEGSSQSTQETSSASESSDSESAPTGTNLSPTSPSASAIANARAKLRSLQHVTEPNQQPPRPDSMAATFAKGFETVSKRGLPSAPNSATSSAIWDDPEDGNVPRVPFDGLTANSSASEKFPVGTPQKKDHPSRASFAAEDTHNIGDGSTSHNDESLAISLFKEITDRRSAFGSSVLDLEGSGEQDGI